MSAATRTPLLWADRLRNLATVLVIAIHASAPVVQQYEDFNTDWWWWANFWDSLSRPAVPLFVALSGFLLLGKDYPIPDFLKRRFSRVVIPALFWMGVFSFYNYQSHGTPATPGQFIEGIVEGPVHYHLWFIYLIIGLYLTYPVLRPFVKQAGETEFLFFFAVCIIGTWGWKTFHTFANVDIGLYIELFSNNAGYFVLGYYLGVKPFKGEASPHPGIKPWVFDRKTGLYVALMLLIAGTAVTMVGTWWASMTYSGGKFHPYFQDYLAPNVTVATIGWFLLARLAFNRAPLLEVEKAFSECSFGIYFTHVLVLDFWSAAGYWHSYHHPFWNMPFLILMATGLVFLAVLFIRALPWGDRIT